MKILFGNFHFLYYFSIKKINFMYREQLVKRREILREDMFAGVISLERYRFLDEKLRRQIEEWDAATDVCGK